MTATALTPTQKTILEAALGHLNGSIHPMPEHIKGGAAKKVIDSLHRQGLIEEDGPQTWRISEAGLYAIGLNLPQGPEKENDSATFEADVAAAEVALAEADPLATFFDQIAKEHLGWHTAGPLLGKALRIAYDAGIQAAQRKPAPRKSGPRENSKQAQVIELLKRPEGATAEQIAEMTGWRNHTIRGFISIAKKKLGLTITAERTRMAGQNQNGSPGSYITYKLCGSPHNL